MTYQKNSTLQWLLRLGGHRPFIGEYKNHRKYKVLGYGPKGKVVCWKLETDELELFDDNEINWRIMKRRRTSNPPEAGKHRIYSPWRTSNTRSGE